MSSPVLKSYVSDARRFDELLTPEGSVRPHWAPFIDRLARNWPESATVGADLTRQLIIENGVTYNVYADPQGKDRPWTLDAVPFVFSADEWRHIETGVAQRAHVLNAVLADLYGSQKLLAEGILPTELAFGHPNFMPACSDSTGANEPWLHVYAADLARAPDGRWRVLADRTQSPSGAGYALENREILSRVYPEQIRESGVRPLQRVFTRFREVLLSDVDASEAALGVVLTSGPLNETYFEHAYLSRQLGLPLVEGSDLTVRNDTVYLKTLSGLKRVHAILRRLDDDFCDPLELRSDSALGVPGLLNAVRARRVRIANALGSGVMESAAWLGFLPGAAEWLTGETLELACVPTWWCGERPALEHVLTHLQQLVIKSAFPNQSFEPVFGRDLDLRGRTALIERIRARPHAYVAQEQVSLSQVPVLRTGQSPGLAARALSIRVYAVADQDGYRVLPGGLARIATDHNENIVSTQRGGGSKDIWVLGERPQDAVTSRSTIVRSPSRQSDIPSRIAENQFWLGRYAERCEAKARLLRATLAARTDLDVFNVALTTCAHFGVTGDPALALLDTQNDLGVPADVSRLTWCATQIRSRLSVEHWRTIGAVQRQLQHAAAGHVDRVDAVDRLLLTLVALAGFLYDDMAQDDGWRLMVIGRRLERLQFVAELLGLRLMNGERPSQNELEWLLEIAGSTIAYRSRYRALPQVGLTLDLLIQDESNPHSCAFQSRAVQTALHQLTASLGGSVEDSLYGPMQRLMDIEPGPLEGDGSGACFARKSLADSLQRLFNASAQLSDSLSLRHFSHIDLRALSA